MRVLYGNERVYVDIKVLDNITKEQKEVIAALMTLAIIVTPRIIEREEERKEKQTGRPKRERGRIDRKYSIEPDNVRIEFYDNKPENIFRGGKLSFYTPSKT